MLQFNILFLVVVVVLIQISFSFFKLIDPLILTSSSYVYSVEAGSSTSRIQLRGDMLVQEENDNNALNASLLCAWLSRDDSGEISSRKRHNHDSWEEIYHDFSRNQDSIWRGSASTIGSTSQVGLSKRSIKKFRRIVLLHAPAFRDWLGVQNFNEKSDSVDDSNSELQRAKFESESVEEHDNLLQGLRKQMNARDLLLCGHTCNASAPELSDLPQSNGFIKIQDYTEVVRGFSAILSEEEEMLLLDSPQVRSISVDKKLQKHSTHASSFLDLNNTNHGIWRSSRGSNIVVGVIDSGIWPESKSFTDTGMPPVPNTFKGKCVSGSDTTFKCNRKLVGARFFGPSSDDVKQCGDYYSPRDFDGHGTAMASIVASNSASVSFNGKSAGAIRGVAFNARIAAYKVTWCSDIFAYTSNTIAGIDAAVKDGVDVLTVSLGGEIFRTSPGEFSEPLGYALYKAALAGIPAILPGGNNGEGGYSVSNGAPWVMTVGAGTQDRCFVGKVVLENGIVYKGTSFYSRGTPLDSLGKANKLFPIITGTDAGDGSESRYCSSSSLIPELTKNKIILCVKLLDDNILDLAKEVKRAGGVAMVYMLRTVFHQDITSYIKHLPIPAVLVNINEWTGLLKYLEVKSNPKAYIPPTEILLGKNQVEAPTAAEFSSIGPNGGAISILKPDIIAPGHGIITAHTQANNPKIGPNPWTVGSGSSHACAFVAGTVALLKAKYPKWTPSMYYSAITTTAKHLTNKHNPIPNNKDRATPFKVGAGQVNPNAAINPGLVYALPSTNPYKAFLCSSESGIKGPYSKFDPASFCESGKFPSTLSRDLNLPSIVFHQIFQKTEVSTQRMLSNVGPEETYTALVYAPKGTTFSVSPKILNFSRGQVHTYKVSMYANSPSFDVTGAYLTNFIDIMQAWWTFGSVTWVGNKGHRVRIVVAVNAL